jgi:hypothetical protein
MDVCIKVPENEFSWFLVGRAAGFTCLFVCMYHSGTMLRQVRIKYYVMIILLAASAACYVNYSAARTNIVVRGLLEKEFGALEERV